MDIGNVFSGDMLKAADLQGSEHTVTIASVDMKKFDNGNKLIVGFDGRKKKLVCNKTNANRIAHNHGPDTDDWIGKEIILYVDLVEFQGSTVEAIRVRAAPKKPQASRPQAKPETAHRQDDMDDEIPF